MLYGDEVDLSFSTILQERLPQQASQDCALHLRSPRDLHVEPLEVHRLLCLLVVPRRSLRALQVSSAIRLTHDDNATQAPPMSPRAGTIRLNGRHMVTTALVYSTRRPILEVQNG